MMSVLSLVPDEKKKDLRKESLESVYSSNSRLNLLTKRKRLTPLNMEAPNHSVRSKSGDRYVTQRVLSAKTHRVKQLQNQLADAHYHLQELSNENRVLRAIQKKQEIALQRYENSNAELPTVLNSHSEEMRVQQAKYKQLKAQHKEALQRLKERDVQLQALKDEHQHLLELSKDKNLLEREKLQAALQELTTKVQQQNETITMLQRRIALEAKNFRHQLQLEMNKHKDTRADLDLAIHNADKLSTIIEMKEKMLSTAASRNIKSPVKSSSTSILARPPSKTRLPAGNEGGGRGDEKTAVNIDQTMLAKLCENSRTLSSALSHDEETSSSAEPRSRYIRSRNISNSTGTRSTPTRKLSKGSDDMVELAKTVQDGMAELAIYDDELKSESPDEMQKKMEAMKLELMNKIKNHEEPRRSSALRRMSTEESIEEQIVEVDEQRPKSRGRRNSNVSFFETLNVEETTTTTSVHEYKTSINDYKSGDEMELMKTKRENSALEKAERFKRETSALEKAQIPSRTNSALERKLSGKPLDKYCKDIIQDIEKSSKVIDKHVKQFNSAKFDNDKIVQQLQAVDKINEIVNGNIEIPDDALVELNNNFKKLTGQVFNEVPVARKRSISGRCSSVEPRSNLLGDVSMSNQELLEDLLGKK